jgi:type I restriction enzyme R subunit
MNEAETRAELIDPALKKAGWGEVEGSRVLRERNCKITDGHLQGAGKCSKPEIAETRRLAAVYQRKLDALTELKQSLLQRALAGEL